MSKKPSISLEPVEIDLEVEEPDSVESPEAGFDSLLSDEVPRMAAKLNLLEALLTLLSRDLSFKEFMTEVLLGVMKAIRCEAGSILEINHNEQMLFFRAAAGHSSDQVTQFVIPLGKGIAGHVAESGEPFRISKLSESKVHLKSISKTIGFDARNLLCVPILVRGQMFGVLQLLNRVGEDEFGESDLEFAEQAMAFVSKAIEIRLMLGWTFTTQRKSQGEDAA